MGDAVGEVDGVEKVEEVNREGGRNSTASTRTAEMMTLGRKVMNFESVTSEISTDIVATEMGNCRRRLASFSSTSQQHRNCVEHGTPDFRLRLSKLNKERNRNRQFE